MKRKHRARPRAGGPRPNPAPASKGLAAVHRSTSARWWIVLAAVPVLALAWWSLRSRFHQPESEPTPHAAASAPTVGPLTNQLQAVSSNRPPVQLTAAKDDVLVDKINKANQLLGQGKPAEALELLRQAEKINPEDEDVHYNLGIALARLGKNEDAVTEYEKALRIFPDYAEVHNNYGNLLVRMGKGQEALRHFEEAVRITPEYASAWNNFGSALQRLGRTNEARDHFEKAATLDSNYWQAHYNLGTSYAQRREFSKAQTEFETVLRLQPDFPPARQALEAVQKQSAPMPAAP